MALEDDLKRKSALRTANAQAEFIPTVEAPPPRTPAADPIAEMRARADSVLRAERGNAMARDATAQRPVVAPNANVSPQELEKRAINQMQRNGITPAQPATMGEFEAARRAQGFAPAPAAAPTTPVVDTLKAGGSRLRGALDSAKSLPGRVIGGTARLAATAAIPAAAVYDAATDTPEQRLRAGGNTLGTGQVGSYLGSALTLGALSPQDIGAVIEGGGVPGRVQAPTNPEEQGWATRALRDALGTNPQPSMATPAAPIDRRSYGVDPGAPDFSNVQGRELTPDDAVLGSFNGRQITRGQANQIAGQLQGPVPGSAPTQQDDVVKSALRAMLSGQDGGGSVGMINSRSGDINRYFDSLASEIKDLHGGAKFQARGSLATKLLRLEEARAQALGHDQSNLVGSQGNVVSDANGQRGLRGNVAATMAGIQNNELDAAVSMRNNDQTVRGSLLREQLENIRAQDAAQRDQEGKNTDMLLAASRARHTDPLTGKVDEAAAQADFNEVVKNAPGVVEGTIGTARAAQAQSQYADERELRDIANQGSDRSNGELLNFTPGSALRRPTFGEVLDLDSDVTIGDKAYDMLPDILPGVESGTIAESSDGRVVRNRRLNETQRRNLLRKLQGK
jgi:hypothetical protein